MFAVQNRLRCRDPGGSVLRMGHGRTRECATLPTSWARAWSASVSSDICVSAGQELGRPRFAAAVGSQTFRAPATSRPYRASSPIVLSVSRNALAASRVNAGHSASSSMKKLRRIATPAPRSRLDNELSNPSDGPRWGQFCPSQTGWSRDSPRCLDDEAATCYPLLLVVGSCAGEHLGQLRYGLPPGGQGDQSKDEMCRIDVAIE